MTDYSERDRLDGTPFGVLSNTCPRCHGEGEIHFNPGWPDPQTEDYAPCPDCHGTGEVDEEEES